MPRRHALRLRDGPDGSGPPRQGHDLRLPARGAIGAGTSACTAFRATSTSKTATSGRACAPVRVSDAAPHFAFGGAEDVRLADVECVFIRKDPPFDAEYLYIDADARAPARPTRRRQRSARPARREREALRAALRALHAAHARRERSRSDPPLRRRGRGRPSSSRSTAPAAAASWWRSAGDRNTRSIVDYHHERGNAPRDGAGVPAGRARPATSACFCSRARSSAASTASPREDDVRSNIHVGGRVEPCEVTAEERAVVADMAPRLAADGLVFVGLDFIGGKLTEVNVTSPDGHPGAEPPRGARRRRARHRLGRAPSVRLPAVPRKHPPYVSILAMPITVIVRRGDAEDARLTFDGTQRVVIGRGAGSDVRLPDASVSHRHAQSARQGGDFVLVDEGSTNGTFVGGCAWRRARRASSARATRCASGALWLVLQIRARSVDARRRRSDARPRAGAGRAAPWRRAATTALPGCRSSEGPDAGLVLVLAEESRPYVVGRAANCDLPLADADASREHSRCHAPGRRRLHARPGRQERHAGSARVRLGASQEVPWRPAQAVRVGRTVLALEEPVGLALAELEGAPDERSASRRGRRPRRRRLRSGAGRRAASSRWLQRCPRLASAERSSCGGRRSTLPSWRAALAILAASLVGLVWLFHR